jgi:HTH-type transcriptional regulator / antitoxin HipB
MSIITDMKLKNNRESLGAEIKKARKQRGLLQSDIAELASVRRQVIGELERGVYKGSLQRAMEVLQAMGLRLTITPVRFPTLDDLSND